MGSNSDFVMNFEQMIHYKDSNQYFFGNSESLWYCPSQPKNFKRLFLQFWIILNCLNERDSNPEFPSWYIQFLKFIKMWVLTHCER